MIKKITTLLILSLVGFSACTSTDDHLYTPNQGIYILNAKDGNSWDVSFFQFLTEEVIDGYYTKMNPNENQSGEKAVYFGKRKNHGFILTQKQSGEATLNVVDFKGFKVKDKIIGFSNPLAMSFLNDSVAVISCGGVKRQLAIVDAGLSKISAEIAMTEEPGQIFVKGKYLYVAHPKANFISIVDHAKKQIVTTIPTLSSPSEIVIDANNDVWVYCNGAGLTKIKHLSWEQMLVSENYELNMQQSDEKFNLGISPSGTYIYYYENGIKRHFIGNNILPDKGFIINEATLQYGGFQIDGRTGTLYYIKKEGTANKVVLYQSNGTPSKELTVGEGSFQVVAYYGRTE